jgi:LmbE family N-acetylglucosaminyl deacetylase
MVGIGLRAPIAAVIGVWVLFTGVGPHEKRLGAQVRPVYSRGIAGLVHVLKRLQTTASAMHTAAHPDDEDTGLIARLARGDHARVAYLSLSRGEGGQNIIGLELFDALGVVRTEELLQARTLDGGDQLFTRAYDFGFTKTVEEAATKWNDDRVLGDMVRAIRLYRPLVVMSRFSGTVADGHGQHQLAGKLTPIAFDAAGDPARFPEHAAQGLPPWQPRKLYVGQSFRSNPGNEPTLQVPTGAYDPLLGRTYYEIAMEGRSQHKSQEMGTTERRGPQSSGLRLVKTVEIKAVPEERGIFDGLDTSVAALGQLAGLPNDALRQPLQAMSASVDRALADLDLRDPTRIIPHLAEGLLAARRARAALATLATDDRSRASAAFLLDVKLRDFGDALERAAGITVDVLADREVAAPGGSLRVDVQTYVPNGSPIALGDVRLLMPPGWHAGPLSGPPSERSDSPFARFFRERPTRSSSFTVTVALDAQFTQPYWLARPRSGEVYQWDDPSLMNLALAPALIRAELDVKIGGVDVVVSRPLEFRYADPVRGEIRRHLNVVPALTVAFDEPLHIVPTRERGRSRRVAVRLHSQTLESATGSVMLKLPAGWRSAPNEIPFSLTARGGRTAAAFDVTPAPDVAPGTYEMHAEASSEGASYRTTMRVVDHPHIQKHRLYQNALASVRVLDLAVAPVRVGYIMGSGDEVPVAIRRMGLDVTMIDDDTLAAGDLSRFDTIVVGVRASESRPGFVANNGRLLEYVREGGTVIVQYQQTDYVTRGLAPYPAQMASRVTDEHAPVRVLKPDHPVFMFPNRIVDEDWNGWVQERNLYAFTSFDPRYTPLLETADPGEPPQLGGQVYARIGKGHYVYTAYAWFRQLPAGVPGAYRLFANLLSLGSKSK